MVIKTVYRGYKQKQKQNTRIRSDVKISKLDLIFFYFSKFVLKYNYGIAI